MERSTVVEETRALAGNLAAQWTGGRPILERLIGAVEDPDISPWGALRRLGPTGIERLFESDSDRQQVTEAFGRLTRYLVAPSWFEQAAGEDARVEGLRNRPVAYFCMEFGLASWLQIYSGGLGILAGDVMKEASDMGLPFVGVGLFYRQGFFHQRLSSDDYQQETQSILDPADLPMEPAVDATGREVSVSVPMDGRQVFVRVWKLQVGRVPLYLLDSDIPENEAEEDRRLTSTLYGGDHVARIQQELLLGIGGVRVLRALGIEPGVYSMNEGHAAFLGVELLLEALQTMPQSQALQQVRRRVVYTNHTVVPAGNDIFGDDLVRHYLSPYLSERGWSIDELMRLGGDGHGALSMAVLAFQLAGKANAVSQLHAQVIPREWPGFPVEAVTNGVHVPTWLGTEMTALLERHVPDWQSGSPDEDAIRSIPAEELWAAHVRQRESLIQFVNASQSRTVLSPEALTLVWARRFAEYKRAVLIARDIDRLGRLMNRPGEPVQLVISGKAHPHDGGGKDSLQSLLHRLYGNQATAPHVVFLEDYSEQVARYLTAGADVWLNTPRKPLEASGTSGMKASDNGALQLTVTDGWAAELNWWQVGWGIEGRDDELDAQDLYQYLEGSVAPLYYRRDAAGVPQEWVVMMKNTMAATLGKYSTRRMLLDYLHKMYLPLLGESREAVEPRQA